MGGQGSGRKPNQIPEPISKLPKPKRKYCVEIRQGSWYFDTQEEARSHAKQLLNASVSFLRVFEDDC